MFTERGRAPILEVRTVRSGRVGDYALSASSSWNVAGRVAFPPLQNPRPLPGDGWRPAVLTLTLGEPADSSCRVEPARRRGSQRERNQHRRVRTTVPPFTEGAPPLRRTRRAGARARRSGKRL